jgi:hypothetical protein
MDYAVPAARSMMRLEIGEAVARTSLPGLDVKTRCAQHATD